MDFAQIRQEEKRVAAVVRQRDAILDGMHLCDETIAEFEREIDGLRNSLRLFENDLKLRSVILFFDKTETIESIDRIEEDIARLQKKIDQENDKLAMFEAQLMDYALADDYVVAVWQQKEAYVSQFEPAQSRLVEIADRLATYEEQRPLLHELHKRVTALDDFLDEHHPIFFPPVSNSNDFSLQTSWSDSGLGGVLRAIEQNRARGFLRELVESYAEYINEHSYLSRLMVAYPIKRAVAGLARSDNKPLARTHVEMINMQWHFVRRKHEVLLQNIAMEKHQRAALIQSGWKRICEEKEPNLDPSELISTLKNN